ncbi:MAG: hypothetical protein DMD62_00395 [Gemmatimonadetes bacterium]|nr:MAG: hypothetical protein DMD62_00395 [Gemmatimonadota bacterium]
MNFKFKLSRRLAIALALSLGCKLGTTGPEGGFLYRIDVAPTRIALVPSQSAPLTVVAFSSKTDSASLVLVQASLQWSTTGGTVSNNGMLGGVRYITYSAPAQPGTYALIVTTVTGWPADTANVTVTATPSPVSVVSMTPGSANLALGDTATLRAALTDASGNTLFGRPIEWSTSDAGVATVLATGFVRAMGPGTVTITASTEGRSGTAVITVPQ